MKAREVMEILRISRSTLRNLRKNGHKVLEDALK
jgi:DNA-binding CsgD family transcriptional regulator